ncbi:hypothetical protein ABEB36_013364 [Hypothenemus hampei]|uniref:Uncharacterized protein n=1 Tax=Hypothenemus hampei TaxID=57062 RepID=A0ABD1E7S8_HYPHA
MEWNEIANVRDLFRYQISSLPINNVPKIEDFACDNQVHKITAFNQTESCVKELKLSQWKFLDFVKTEELLQLTNPQQIYKFIGSNLQPFLKGRTKELFIKLMVDVTKFCQKQEYITQKATTVLSQFYQTHIYFICNADSTAEKIYIYFKDLVLQHSLPFPPNYEKVFNLKESRDILQCFVKIYLRNLPLIKYLDLPIWALYLNYTIPTPLIVKKEKHQKKSKKKKGKK